MAEPLRFFSQDPSMLSIDRELDLRFRAETPEHAAAIAVDALRLRYRLMPYIYSVAVDSARTGEPMMRALLLDSPDDPAAWTTRAIAPARPST